MIEVVKMPQLSTAMWARNAARIPPQWRVPIGGPALDGEDDYYDLPPTQWPGLEVVGPTNQRRSLMAPVQTLSGCMACGADEVVPAASRTSWLKLACVAGGVYLGLKLFFG